MCFLTKSEITKFSIWPETNGASWIVKHFILWQPSYNKSLEYSRAILRISCIHTIQALQLQQHTDNINVY